MTQRCGHEAPYLSTEKMEALLPPFSSSAAFRDLYNPHVATPLLRLVLHCLSPIYPSLLAAEEAVVAQDLAAGAVHSNFIDIISFAVSRTET